jgi:hypothetical protein
VPSSLVTAFRQQFPRGSILAEVLTIQDGLFVVRVSVLAEGQTLSQALAANTSLELAEDIACNRALERLCLTTTPGVDGAVTRVNAPQPGIDLAVAAVPPLPLSADTTVPTGPEASLPPGLKLAQIPAAPVTHPETPAPEDGIPEKKVPAAKLPEARVPENSHPPAGPDPADPSQGGTGHALTADDRAELGRISADPIDLSDIIAQTDVELQRLGWDVNQGREFLEKTYGKRSRHDLSDEELLEFLLYLEGQPMTPA